MSQCHSRGVRGKGRAGGKRFENGVAGPHVGVLIQGGRHGEADHTAPGGYILQRENLGVQRRHGVGLRGRGSVGAKREGDEYEN